MILGGLDTAMPPQFDNAWTAGPLSLPGTEDFSSLDDFSIFDELNLDDTPPLFESLLPDGDLHDIMADVLEPSISQVRHDCMWAGTCVEDKERPNPQDRLQEVPVKAPAEPVVKDTRLCAPIPIVQTQTRVPPVKCNQRSLLRTNQNQSNSDQLRTAPPQEDSDDSGRPETPQSMSSDPELESKHNVDFGSSSFNDDYDQDEDDDDDDVSEEDEEEDETAAVSDEEEEEESLGSVAAVSDVTGQTVRTTLLQGSEGLHRGHASRFDSRPQQNYHLFNDHSYHLSKSDVSASIPGNLTPSDSEDEIDVVSVCGEKGSSSSRSSSQGALPTNPSARDRHALQQTMASAMKGTTYSAYLSKPSGKLARMYAERQRKRRRGGAQDRDDSSEEDSAGRPSKKRAKHHHHKHAAHAAHAAHAKRGSFKVSSSDSEPDSCEKRSLHNNMERQRRVDLRNAFEDLRVVVPKLSPNPRAAKVVILKEASHFCHQLTADCKALQQESSILERERERLLARVQFLRKQVASMRRI